jgi:lipopolysaccharide export LptBFGC system permease protein LptF
MGNTPEPLNSAKLSRGLIAGAVLAVVGIGLFIALWVILGSMGVSNAARLLVSLCIPPAIIALILGGYILLRPKG